MQNWTDSTDQTCGKSEFYLQLKELLDEAKRMSSSPVSRAQRWRRKTPTAAAERMRSAAGVRTVSVRSRQLSASSSASSRASVGARVCERWRRRKKDFDRAEIGIYKDRDSTTQLRW